MLKEPLVYRTVRGVSVAAATLFLNRVMDRTDALAVARTTGWLAALPPRDREDILSRTELLHFSASEPIYNAGEEAGGLFGVVKGSLKLWLLPHHGEDGLAHISGVGNWVGDVAAVSGRSRRITITAASDCIILRLPRARLLALAEEKPHIWRAVAQLLSINFLLAMDVIDTLRREDPVERLAATLLNLIAHTSSVPAIVGVSQADLGAIARLSRSTVNRSLAELSHRGWVRLKYGSVEIVDVKGLSGMVWGE